MEVLSKLRINGGDEAYLVRDSELTYPILSTCFHVESVFNQLLASGYKFCGLPFDFRKDGVSILTLPVRDYEPTYNEEQDMYDLDSVPKMDTQTLLTKISHNEINYLEEPAHEYTCYTREDFIRYLEGIRTMKVEEIAFPINYFVHPNARFTVDEWMSGQYEEYFRIMANRRSLSHIDFCKLRNWLKQYHPTADRSSGDFIEAYSLWGIDGINVQFVSRKRKTHHTNIAARFATSSDDYTLTYSDYCLVDRYGMVTPPADVNTAGEKWNVLYQGGREDPAFRRLTSSIGENEFGIVQASFLSPQEIIELQGLRDTFIVTPYRIMLGYNEMRNFGVSTFDISPVVISERWWGVAYDNRVLEMSKLRAVAHEIIQQRKMSAEVSSFKALQYVGLDIRSALMYMIDKLGNESKMSVDDGASGDVIIPNEKDVDMFVSGNYDMDSLSDEGQEKLHFLESIISGETNVDSTEDGAKSDKAIDVRVIYKYLYCLRYCKNVDMDTIFKLAENTPAKVVKYKDMTGYESDVLQVPVAGGFVVNIPCPVLNAKVQGYNSDILRYKVLMSEECTCFCKVLNVAKEYGIPEANRHVAFEGAFVKLLSGTAKTQAVANLNKLYTTFDTALLTIPEQVRKRLATYRSSVCMREYFRVAEFGYMLLGPELGNTRVEFSEEFVNSVRSTISYEITTTAAYCRRMYLYGHFTHFCVNADITPFSIVPTSNVTLPEVHIRALWDDLSSIGAVKIENMLRDSGYLYNGFLSWNYRYAYSEHFTYLDDLPPIVDLCRYVMYCKDFCSKVKTTEIFEHVPHIETLVYGYYPAEDELVDNGTKLRDGAPPAVVSKARFITKKNYPEHALAVEEPLTDVDNLRPFTGFDYDDFKMLQDVREVELPNTILSDKYVIVGDSTLSTESQDDLPYYVVEQLVGKGYPVIRLYGRRYVLRDMYGSLWEVTV